MEDDIQLINSSYSNLYNGVHTHTHTHTHIVHWSGGRYESPEGAT